MKRIKSNAYHRRCINQSKSETSQSFTMAFTPSPFASLNYNFLRMDAPEEYGRTKRVHQVEEAIQARMNCIARYRAYEGYSLRELGGILGVSAERARMLCAMEQPPRSAIHLLGVHEGISDYEFLLRYDTECTGDAA